MAGSKIIPTPPGAAGPWDRPLDRRRALRLMGAGLGACLLGLGPAGLSSAAVRRPNILFILSDDHRWDAMGNMGHPFLQTPALDSLTSQGVRFDNAFVTTSLCSPSRASFLTGQFAHTHGVQNNLTPWREENVTFLEILKRVGYDTAFLGKWHMPGHLPELRGVDEFVTFTVQGGQGRYFDCPLVVNGKEEPSRKPYITEELTDRALEFMARPRENPFCVYLSHKAVHHQFLPPPETDGMYKGKDLNLSPEADPWISWSQGQLVSGVLGPLDLYYRHYCEALTALDQQIGRVLDYLDKSGQGRDTIVIYAGDNGYFWGEHRLVDKRWPYEESIRIPLIIKAPHMANHPGRPAGQLVTNVDLAPTILEMAGLPTPASMEGRSMAPYLRDRGEPGRDAILYEYFKDFPYTVPEHRAVRTRRYKYIRYEGPMGEELFDLQADPHEKSNLMGTVRERVLKPDLARRLDELISQGGRS